MIIRHNGTVSITDIQTNKSWNRWTASEWSTEPTSRGLNWWHLIKALSLTHYRLNELPHYYWKILISILGMLGYVIKIFREKKGWIICKQWRPLSDAVFCGVWSGSALFANYLLGVSRLQWVNSDAAHKIINMCGVCVGSFYSTVHTAVQNNHKTKHCRRRKWNLNPEQNTIKTL